MSPFQLYTVYFITTVMTMHLGNAIYVSMLIHFVLFRPYTVSHNKGKFNKNSPQAIMLVGIIL